MGQTVKNLPAMQDTWVRSLGREDPLEKRMVTHSSILAWRIPWTRSLAVYSPWCHRELDTTEQLTLPRWKVWHSKNAFSAQHLTSLKSRGLWTLFFQAHWWWQNLVPCGHMMEYSISLLVKSWGLLSASGVTHIFCSVVPSVCKLAMEKLPHAKAISLFEFLF